MNKHQFRSLLGVIGGIFFMAGDCLIFCYKGNIGAEIDPLWIDVSMWRFVISAIFGFIGMSLMIPAYLSFKKMIDDTCGGLLRLFTIFMGVGVVSTGYLHFALGSLSPITYKSIIESGGTVEMATAVCKQWSEILTPINLILILFLCFEYLVHFIATVSGKLKLPRVMCFVGILGAFAIGMIWKLIFKGTAAEGAYGAFESLGETLTFLTAFFYWTKSKEVKRSLKYSILLALSRFFGLQKVMELPPEKAKKLFAKAYKGVVIPDMKDDELNITTEDVKGSTCVWYKHKNKCERACIYIVGGGMLKYPKPSQAKEVLSLSKELNVDFVLPFYPLVHTGNTLPDVYDMMYTLYKNMLNEYSAENIYFLGCSSGANLAIGLISYINDLGEGIPMPGKVYAGSPGSLLVSDEERKKADILDKTDVIMSQKATLSVWEGMTGGKKVADYMESLQLGDYTGLKDVYLSFGADEVFTAAADSIKKRLEEYGVHVTMEIEEGLYHAYACIPLVKDAMPGYERMKEYIKK